MITASNGLNTALSLEMLSTNKFWIEVQGMLMAAFTECSGLQASIETTTLKEGGVNNHVHTLPVRTTFSNITLKRGIGITEEFWNWFNDTLKGKPKKRDVTILMFSPNEPGVIVKGWAICNAFPVKWGGPTLSSKSQDFAIESIELSYEWFKPLKDLLPI